ncbi:MAG: cation diffusion facilitator family transporter [Deltaproteobacteria bacterium]
MKEDVKLHYSRVRNVLIWVLILNWAVASAKVLYGLFSRCSSMTADGFHSLSDGASNIVGLIGIYLACQPVDEDHPYGHKKYETLFSLAIAALLFFLSFDLFRQGIKRIYNPVLPRIDYVNFAIMLATMGINMGVMRYEFKKGKGLHSDILVSDSMHTRADIFTSISVIITLVAIKMGYPILDPVATMVIALFIAHAGWDIAKESSSVLCDAAPIVDVKKISDIVLNIKGVKTCHKIRTRGRPDDIYVDLHVQVNPDMHMDTAHKISYTIEEEIKKNIPEITEVLVHMEPKE